MAEIELSVLACDRHWRTLGQDAASLMSFVYDASYGRAPLSLYMPDTNRTYGQAVVRPYLFDLLPDSE